MNIATCLTAGASPTTSAAEIEIESAHLPGIDGYERVNSLIPSILVDVGVDAFKLISDNCGVIPTTTFPNTSVTFALYFTTVEVLAEVNGTKFRLYAGPAVPRM